MFSGAMTAMVTPFRDGKLDENRLREQIEFQIKNGIDGLVPVGTTGESPTVDFDEHERVIELTIKHAAGRVPVIAGVGANATSEAIELHRYAKKAGATAGLSVNPYYNKPSQEGLYRHFMTLADTVDLPIVLYNIPGRTGITMSAATVARLAPHKNIVAIKEATGVLDIASEIRSLCDLPILSGDDSLTLPLMSIGASRRDQRGVQSRSRADQENDPARRRRKLRRGRDDSSQAVSIDQEPVRRRQPGRHQICDERSRVWTAASCDCRWWKRVNRRRS